MALDKIVDSRQLDAALLSIANAIREKSGSTRPLNFPADFVTEIGKLGGDGLTDEIKQAILQLGQKVAYIDAEGQEYYNDLYNALYPPKTVVLLTAVFRQGSTVIYDDTALDDLKQYLTVTAKYEDNTTSIIADNAYSLSGLLEAPSSTVTVLYNGVSTTFSVAVTARPTLSSITATYTQSGTVYDTDALDSLKDDLVVTAHYSDSSTQTVPDADYTLSGTIAVAGTSTIIVSYGGKTATFDVTVTEYPWFTTFGYGWADLTTSYIQYSAHTWTRGMTNPFMILMPAGTYEVSLGAYNDTQDYYYNPSSVIATSALREVDFTFTNKTTKRFANGTFEVLKPEAEDGSEGWMMVRHTFTFAQDQFVLWAFRKGTTGSTQFTDTDVTNLMNNFTIRRLS